MSVRATVKGVSAGQDAGVLITITPTAEAAETRMGGDSDHVLRESEVTVVLTPAEGRVLQHEILNVVLGLERAERDEALAKKVTAARRHERELRRSAKVDEKLRENDG